MNVLIGSKKSLSVEGRIVYSGRPIKFNISNNCFYEYAIFLLKRNILKSSVLKSKSEFLRAN